ncbi:hypothetical protein QJS04_geneDACA023083 [Acorus gramineus]|uniref:Uncharacterized protein n=1 Tax=Acorus gramineus TaxID=55184 RepID=A0AAV9A0Z5_ACOGR|nr:hypothetical protein QJS04_geneDACA023083 [Acorus gramineus]
MNMVGVLKGFSGPVLLNRRRKLKFSIQRHGERTDLKSLKVLVSPIRHTWVRPLKLVASVAGPLSDGRGFVKRDEFDEKPFWQGLIKDAIWGLKWLAEFLVEQPSQLKCIEWPSFQSTLKTASLTVVLVALLIVALSSIDSALVYLLAFFLRRSA